MADEKNSPAESNQTSESSLQASSPPASKAAPKESASATAKKPPKKEKPPAPEDKPFTEFIEQHFMPSLDTAFKDKGIDDIQLTFDQQPLEVFGVKDEERYWHVKGKWGGGDRQFNIVFTKDDISSPKLFYLADKGSQPSTIEQFMGDERKINLDLLVLFTLMRLNGQKWLARN